MSHPPLEDSGKLLISIVICVELDYCIIYTGAGGCDGKDAKITPKIGETATPA